MEDEMTEEATPKTKTLDAIDTAKSKKITGFADYQKAAAALMDARKAVQTTKAKVKRVNAGVFGLKSMLFR